MKIVPEDSLKMNGQNIFFLLFGTRPVCFIRQQTIAMIKVSNLKRHYETKHKMFKDIFPEKSEEGTTKINAVKSSYKAASGFVKSMIRQEKAKECSLTVLWILGKHTQPFSDAEILRV